MRKEQGRERDTDLGIIYIKKAPEAMKVHSLTTKISYRSLKNRIQPRTNTKVSGKMATKVKRRIEPTSLEAGLKANRSNAIGIMHKDRDVLGGQQRKDKGALEPPPSCRQTTAHPSLPRWPDGSSAQLQVASQDRHCTPHCAHLRSRAKLTHRAISIPMCSGQQEWVEKGQSPHSKAPLPLMLAWRRQKALGNRKNPIP